MAITQVTFCGASVTSFNASCGWNSQESTVDISLVEDTRNGDAFIVPVAGDVRKFEYEGFSFAGLVRDVSMSGSSGGSPLYAMTLVDPRVLLSGVQVMLGEYYGPVGVPNVANIYGYLERDRFGNSGANSSGIVWGQILLGIDQVLGLGSGGPFGGPISYKGNVFKINLQNLPLLNQYYRLSGTMSLMDIISTVCEAGGCDFFVELIDDVITIYTISRINIPDSGVIDQFVLQTDGAVSKNLGHTMVNEPCGKLLLGGRKRDMYFQFYGGGADKQEKTGDDNPLWWFWGFDLDGNIIKSNGLGDDLNFTLDSRRVSIPGVGTTYKTSVGEIKAAMHTMSTWESYLSLTNDLSKLWNPRGSQKTLWPGSTTQYYNHNGINNPHRGKSDDIGVRATFAKDIAALLDGPAFGPGQKMDMKRISEITGGKRDEAIDVLYNLIKGFADEFYGKKILVSIPPIRGYRDPDSETMIYNMLPVSGGYLTDADIASALANNKIPKDTNSISNPEDGTIQAYVRFNDIGTLDLSEIPDDDVLLSANGQYAFIRCSIEDKIYFMDKNAMTGPRVIATLPGRVKFREDEGIFGNMMFQVMKQFCDNDSDKAKQVISTTSGRAFKSGGADTVGDFPRVVLPAMVAVPLESQVDRYGPWYATGANGATEFEEDDSLTPWNYGDYNSMNEAANARVVTNIANLQMIESGSIEFPGSPGLSLGSQLLNTGPFVSNIRVSAGSDGVKTTYNMETWRPRFGTMNKLFADRVQKTGKAIQQSKRNFKELLKRKR